jgi:hypothetical protein
MFTQSCEDYTQMFSVVFLIFRIYQDDINEYHHKLVQFGHKHRIHQVHEVCGGVGQAEGHNKILIKTVSYRESCFWNIFQTDFNLMVARPQIDLGKDFIFRQLINKMSMRGRGYLILTVTAFRGL